MANEKITLAAIRQDVAKQTGYDEVRVGNFLSAFFPAIVEGLRRDSQVRVQGLGVFRMQWIEPRRSVNVQTGEAITIEGYNRVVFTPDKPLRESVNAPYSHLQPQVIDADGNLQPIEVAVPDENDPIKRLSEQAEEIKDIIAGFSETEKTQEAQEASEIPETEVTQESTHISDSKEKSESEEKQDNSEIVESKNYTSTMSEETIIVEPQDNEEKKSKKPLIISLIIIVLLCLALVIAYFFLQNKINQWAYNLLHKPQPEVVITEPEEPDTTVVAEPLPELKPIPERTYNSFIKTEYLTRGSRLAHLSRKYYGAPDFWVYIYEANQSKIKNPNQILIGTPVRVPRLPQELIDTQSEDAMRWAHELHEQYKDIR